MKNILTALVSIVAISVAAYFVFSGKSSKKEEAPDDEPRRPKLVQSRKAARAGKGPGSLNRRGVRVSREKLRNILRQSFVPNPNGRKGLVFAGRLGEIGEPFDGIYRDDDGKPFDQPDQKLMSMMEQAFDEDDVEILAAVAEVAILSKNKEVRENIVRSLGWHGSRTLVEMTPFLSDPDPEIAELAHDEWMNSLQDIEDDGVKAGVIEMALRSLADKDMLEDVASELTGIDDLKAIQTIANIMDTGGAAVPFVDEAYADITGEDHWTTFEAAEAWLQENYSDPDAPDDDGAAGGASDIYEDEAYDATAGEAVPAAGEAVSPAAGEVAPAASPPAM